MSAITTEVTLFSGGVESSSAVLATVNTGFLGPRGRMPEWFFGEGEPDNGTGQDGDAYLRSDGQVWAKDSGAWADSGVNIKGAVGDVNPQMPVILAAAEDARDAALLAESQSEANAASASIDALAADAAATAAVAARNKAEKWADEAEDVEVETGKYSGRHWSDKSAASASAAATSESNAGTSETNAGTSAAAASGDAAAANTSRIAAQNAETGATNQAGIATTQAGIATAAAGVATTKAGEASGSAQTAANSEAAAIQAALDAAAALAGVETREWLYGAGEPDNSGGSNGDRYLQSNGNVWAKVDGAWVFTGINLKPAIDDVIDDTTPSATTTYSSNKITNDFVGNADPRLSDARVPTGGAGGVLDGEYPNPGFAVDMATQAELDNAIATRIAATEKGAPNGVATLNAQQHIPVEQLPPIAITEHLGASADQTAMLALVGQKGDWTIRTDLGTVWVITGADPSLLAHWQELGYPTAPVSSVAGKTGAVELMAADIGGAVDTTDARLSDAREWTADEVSEAEAQGGEGTTARKWTAQRVRQAIAAWWANVALKANNAFEGIQTFLGIRETVKTITGTAPALSIVGGRIATSTLTGATTPTAGSLASGDALTWAVTHGAHAISWSNFTVVGDDIAAGGGVTFYEVFKIGSTAYVAKVGSTA